MTRHPLYKTFSWLLFVSFTCLCLWYLWSYFHDIIDYFTSIRWHYTFSIFLAHIVFILCGGLTFAKLCQAKRYNTHWHEWGGLAFFANFINQLLPYRPGILLRYIYLKRHYQMCIRDYLSLNFFFFVLMLICGCLFFVLGFIYLPVPIREKFSALHISTTFVVWSAAVICSTLIMMHFIITIVSNRNLDAIFKRAKLLLSSKGLHGFLTMLAAHMALCISFYSAFAALDIPIPLTEAIFISGTVSISMIFPITPGNVGVIESLVGMLTLWWYGDFGRGVAVCLLYRAVLFISSSCGCMLFFYLLADKIPSLYEIKNWSKQAH